MLLLLVRHGHAGSKRHRHSDDQQRPLTKVGHAEADALVALLEGYRPTRIITSPYLRCVQTVAPLSDILSLRIERSKRLVPSDRKNDGSFLLRVSREDPGPIVLCTHGEVIHEMQLALERKTPDLFGKRKQREKGSVWALERDNGRIVSAEYLGVPRSP